MSASRETTRIVNDLAAGDRAVASRLIPVIYAELRELAARHLARERPDHTLQPTALVNEVYLRVVNADDVTWQGRAQFFALAARQIRKILIDHARRHAAAKRGGNACRVTLDEAAAAPPPEVDVLALDEALDKLASRSLRQASVVELRFYGGLSVEESAEVLGVSPATIKDDWAIARAWMKRELSRGTES